jgi:hypothetical protein
VRPLAGLVALSLDAARVARLDGAAPVRPARVPPRPEDRLPPRVAPAPVRPAPSSVVPALAAQLLGLPGGADAVSALERARLSPDQQARVVGRLMEIHRDQGVQHAGKLIHRIIADVRNAQDREAEVTELIPPLPDLAGVDREHVATMLEDLTAEYGRTRDTYPEKAEAQKAQIAQLKAHLGIREASRPKKCEAPTTEEQRRHDPRTKPPSPQSAALFVKYLENPPHV